MPGNRIHSESPKSEEKFDSNAIFFCFTRPHTHSLRPHSLRLILHFHFFVRSIQLRITMSEVEEEKKNIEKIEINLCNYLPQSHRI